MASTCEDAYLNILRSFQEDRGSLFFLPISVDAHKPNLWPLDLSILILSLAKKTECLASSLFENQGLSTFSCQNLLSL